MKCRDKSCINFIANNPLYCGLSSAKPSKLKGIKQPVMELQYIGDDKSEATSSSEILVADEGVSEFNYKDVAENETECEENVSANENKGIVQDGQVQPERTPEELANQQLHFEQSTLINTSRLAPSEIPVSGFKDLS